MLDENINVTPEPLGFMDGNMNRNFWAKYKVFLYQFISYPFSVLSPVEKKPVIYTKFFYINLFPIHSPS